MAFKSVDFSHSNLHLLLWKRYFRIHFLIVSINQNPFRFYIIFNRASRIKRDYKTQNIQEIQIRRVDVCARVCVVCVCLSFKTIWNIESICQLPCEFLFIPSLFCIHFLITIKCTVYFKTKLSSILYEMEYKIYSHTIILLPSSVGRRPRRRRWPALSVFKR